MFTRTEVNGLLPIPLNTTRTGWVSSNGYPSIWDIELTSFSSILTGSSLTECIEKITYNTKDTETKYVTVNMVTSDQYAIIESPLY